MKSFIAFMCLLFAAYSSHGKERAFTGSTPADPVIRTFFNIPLTDSIDFIRWNLILRDHEYQLNCNYGIGQNNTNGFINGGRKIELKGALRKEGNYFILQNADKNLYIAELNEDLLHFVNNAHRLLVGNGGWSYTLCSLQPVHTSRVNLKSNPPAWRDSMTFQGRTPCGIPGIIPAGKICYKLKWYIALYPNATKNGPGQYKILGTTWRQAGGRKGSWSINTLKDGRIIYQMNDEQGKGFMYLLKLDDHILVFTDADGKLLVGDEDFSYTMNGIK